MLKKNIVSKLIKILALVIAGSSILLFLVFATLQTRWVKNKIAALVSVVLSTEEQIISIQGLDGLLPFDISVQSFTIRDDQGVALRLEDAGLAWDPLSLFTGRVKVTSIKAKEFILDHLPTKDKESELFEKGKPLRLPNLPPLTIESVDLQKIRLSQSIIGSPGVFSAQAKLTLPSWKTVKGSLEIVQTDKPGLCLKAQIRIKEQSLEAELTVQDHPKGFLDTLTGSNLAFPLILNLNGQGRLQNWHGAIQISSKSGTIFSSSLNLSADKESTSLFMKSRAQVLDLLPDKISQIFKVREIFPIEVGVIHETKNQVLKLNTIKLKTSLADFRLSGELDLQKRVLDLQAGLNCPELDPFKSLLSIKVGGKAGFDLKAEGSWDSPDIKLNLNVENLFLSEINFQKAELTLFTALPNSSKDQPIIVQGYGHLSSLLKGNSPMTSGPVDLDFRTSFYPSGLLKIDNLQLNSTNEHLQVSGKLEPEGYFSSTLSASLLKMKAQPLLQKSGLSGEVDLKASLKGDLNPRSISAKLTARTKELRGLPKQAHALFGSHQKLTGDFFLNPKNILSISSLNFKTPHMAINLAGQVDTKSGLLDLDTKLKGPDLEQVKLTSARGLQGLMNGTGSLTGSFSAMQARFDIDIQNLKQKWLKPSNLSINLTAVDLPQSPTGSLKLCLKRHTTDLCSSLNFALSNQILKIKNLSLSAPKTQIKGQARWTLKDPQTRQASLELQADSLTWLETFIPFSCHGEVLLKADYSVHDSTQDISAMSRIQKLRLPWLSIGQIKLLAKSTGLDPPAGSVSLNGLDIKIKDISLTSLNLKGQGNMSKAGFALSTKGRFLEPFSFQTKGELISKFNQKIVIFKSSQGSFSRLRFGWDESIRILKEAETISLSESEINLGRGKLLLEAQISNMSKIKANIRIRDIDLKDLPLDGLQYFSGNFQSNLKILGTLQNPKIWFQAFIEELQKSYKSASDMVPLKASFKAEYEDKTLQVGLKAFQSDSTIFQSRLILPVDFALRPFELITKGDMHGLMSCRMDLDRLNNLLPLVGYRIGGKLKLDIKASGPFKKPSFNGDFEIDSGSYEQALTGFALTNISLAGKVQDRTITIYTLRASDGEKGSLSGQGKLQIKPDQGLDYQLSAELDSARLIRLDIAQGSVSGNIEFKGSSDQAKVIGNLSIFPLEVSLPQPEHPGTSGLVIRDSKDILEKGPEKGQLTKASQDSFLDKTYLNIGVTLPKGTFVRGRGLNSEWQADLKVQGQASAPKINGQIQIVRGHLYLLTKRFTLTEASINFTNQFPPQPLLNITASHQAKDIEVIVSITGPTGNPTIKLESDPALPRDEILAHLLFNRELSTITPLQAVKLALAVRTLASGGNGGLIDKTRSMVGLDELDVKTDGQKEDTIVGVGKYLNENIYFKVEKGLDDQSGQVTVNIEISPSFSLETRAGALNQGMTFKWNYQY